MYDLKQAAILAYTQVSTLLKEAGYQPIMGSIGMWMHHKKKKQLSLCWWFRKSLMINKRHTASWKWPKP